MSLNTEKHKFFLSLSLAELVFKLVMQVWLECDTLVIVYPSIICQKNKALLILNVEEISRLHKVCMTSLKTSSATDNEEKTSPLLIDLFFREKHVYRFSQICFWLWVALFMIFYFIIKIFFSSFKDAFMVAQNYWFCQSF